MKLDFAKNTKRNIIASSLNSLIRMLFPFLNRTLFLWLLGPEYLGLNGLMTSVIGVLSMAELGFGTAVVCAMYKPVAEDDRELLCAYLRFFRTAYRWVGATIFLIGLCLLPFLGNLVHGHVPDDVDLHILYLIYLVNTSASYFLFAYRGSVLGAHHRNDVATNLRSAVSVAQYITTFLVLLVTRNYYHYIIATVFFTVLQNVLLVKASRKYFPDIEPHGDLPPEQRRRVVSDIKSIFMHKVGGVITNSTDNIIISTFLGLVAVATYGNYYYVLTTVGTMVASIYSTMTGGFGNKIHTESREANFRLLMRMARLTLLVTTWCAAMMSALYQPFISIWTHGDSSLLRHALTPALMVLYFYIMQSRQILLTFKSAAALWRQDRWKPIVAGAVNLATNMLFVIFLPEEYKLDGVIFSTIISFILIQIPWESHVVFSSFFCRREFRAYWQTNLRLAAFALSVCLASLGAASLVRLDGVFGFLAKGAVAAVVSGAMLAVAYGKDLREFWLSRRRSL